MNPAHRLDKVPVYVFASLAAKLKELQAGGLDVIRLDIGSPDGPPPVHVIRALSEAAARPDMHSYAGYGGTPQLRQAMADYYFSRFGVQVDPATELLPLLGSKEGIANMAQAWLDAGDVALVPDPGYPTYRMSTLMVGGSVYDMPLRSDSAYLPDFSLIPHEVANRARLMWLNYPNNPTGAVASLEFFSEALEFCRRHSILLCHDAPYADVCFDGYRAPSILEIPGAMNVAVEFNSLSKSHNMAGWRVGMAVGNREAIRALLQVKSNVDSGIFLPIQEAAVAALAGDQSWIGPRNAQYQARRDLLHEVLTVALGTSVELPQASLYLWPRVPSGLSSAECAERILMATGVSFTPGTAFGPHGEGFLRVSVGQTTERVQEAVRRLRGFRF